MDDGIFYLFNFKELLELTEKKAELINEIL
jgi:hypothetical protein